MCTLAELEEKYLWIRLVKYWQHSATGCHLHDCSFFCYPLTCFFWQVAILLSLQLAAEIQEDFFFVFFCFQFLMQRWKICSFYFYRKYLQFFQEAIWMQIFLLLSRGDLQVDVFSLWVWAQPEAALHTSPELCQGKLAQWHWGQFKAISFSIMCNLTFLVLLDKSSENDFIFTLFKLLKYFFS